MRSLKFGLSVVLLCGTASSVVLGINPTLLAGGFPARVVSVSTQKKIVAVELCGTTLCFRTNRPERYAIGATALVKPGCVELVKNHCNFASPYQLKVGGELVEALSWKFPESRMQAVVHHAPGDGDTAFEGLIIHAMLDRQEIMMTLRFEDPADIQYFTDVKRNDIITISVPEDKPDRVLVAGVSFINTGTFFPWGPRPQHH